MGCMKKYVLFLVLALFGFLVTAQNTRNVAAPKPPKPQYQAVKKEKKGLFSFLKKDKKKKTNADQVAEFRTRVKRAQKENAKEEKLADKKRYKEHGYFGHKRPPKKRPPEKMKFCKVCKIKH